MIPKVLCAISLLSASSALLTANPPEKGVVISTDVSGYGLNAGNHRKDSRGTSDIWWNYLIKSACFSYLVVSRITPSAAALQPNNPIRFSEKKGRIYILDRNRHPLALKIVRKDKLASCR